MDKQKPSMNDKSAIHHDYYNDLKTHKTYQKERSSKIILFSPKGAKIQTKDI